MLTRIRIRNLRSLVDTGHIEIKPLNILVGTNSSGKSTFLRVFPLLKQSMENSSAGPVLWFGRYVDFGSLREAINTGASPRGLSFDFTLTTPESGQHRLYLPHHVRQIPSHKPLRIGITLDHDSKDVSYTSALEVEFEGNLLRLQCKADGTVTEITSCGYKINPQRELRITRGLHLIPYITRSVEDRNNREQSFYSMEYLFYYEMHEILSKIDKRIIKKDRINRLLGIFFEFDIPRLITKLQNISSSQQWQDKTAHLAENDSEVIALRSLAFANLVFYLLRLADGLMSSSMRNVSYIQPFRTGAQRYYRIQDLSIREIDPRGENLAMFFRSLSSSQQKSFQDLASKFLGVRPGTRSSRGHVELTLHEDLDLKEHNLNEDFNLADVGYGYSQVLPVIAQIWSVLEASSRQHVVRQAILAVEQPELHLHPAAQSLLADLFADAVRQTKKNNSPFAAVIETHSETLVNRLGRLVQKGVISAQDVQILVFSKKSSAQTSVSVATFSEDGELQNWPYGFFLPDVD